MNSARNTEKLFNNNTPLPISTRQPSVVTHCAIRVSYFNGMIRQISTCICDDHAESNLGARFDYSVVVYSIDGDGMCWFDVEHPRFRYGNEGQNHCSNK